MLEFKNSIDSFEELKEKTWCCKFTLDAIENANKEEEFMYLLEAIFDDNETNPPTLTELNDFIRFETDFIFEELGIEEE